ncbi:MAG: carboxypeptidase regulatory-like domain-containing protein [Gemmatimonadota bacterium]|jgi:hypothetical protein
MNGMKHRMAARVARSLTMVAIFAALVVAGAEAQQGTATLRGVVFDSTEMKALPGARVAVLGTHAMTNADSTGRFELTDIPAGTHLVSFFHPRLQSLGVSAPTHSVTFASGQTVELRLTVPSESTLLMGWCMAEQPGPGFAAVAGVVTDSLTGVPLPSATVTATLTNRAMGDPGTIETRTDEYGYYRICTIPAGREVKIQPHFGRSSGRSMVMTLDEGSAKVEDLLLLMSAEGTVVGTVEDYSSGRPLAGATLSVVGTDIRQVTDSTGAFVLDGLPPGRHLIRTEYLGYASHTDSVTVFSQETVEAEVRLSQEALEVEGLVVTARSRFGKRTSLATNKRADLITRAEIEPLLPRVQSTGDLLRQMNTPGLMIREVQVTDASGVVVPGLCVELSRRTRGSIGCNQAAVFLNGVIMPYPEQILQDIDPNSIDRIEILSPIDAQFQFGTVAGNGAVLIYTR